jgi:hypothetical protein
LDSIIRDIRGQKHSLTHPPIIPPMSDLPNQIEKAFDYRGDPAGAGLDLKDGTNLVGYLSSIAHPKARLDSVPFRV